MRATVSVPEGRHLAALFARPRKWPKIHGESHAARSIQGAASTVVSQISTQQLNFIARQAQRRRNLLRTSA